MASTITAGNATNGLGISSDNTGILQLKSGTGAGTTALTIDASQNATFAGTVTATNLFGVGQTWTNVTASRAIGTTYTNSTGKAIAVSVYKGSGTVANSFWLISVGGVSIGSSTQVYSASAAQQAFFIVPSETTYVLTNGSGATVPAIWAELR